MKRIKKTFSDLYSVCLQSKKNLSIKSIVICDNKAEVKEAIDELEKRCLPFHQIRVWENGKPVSKDQLRYY